MKNVLQHWFKKYIAQEIPSELAVCEFVCNEHQCTRSKLAKCELWKSYNRSLKAHLN